MEETSGWIIYLMAKLEWFFPEVSRTALFDLGGREEVAFSGSSSVNLRHVR